MKPLTLALGLTAVAALAVAASQGSAARPISRRKVWPVNPKRGILSPFGASRTRDNGEKRFHAGADLGALPGDEIVAWGDGEVLYMVSGFGIYGKSPPAGYVPLQAVAVRHPLGIFDTNHAELFVEFIYAEIRVDVKPGDLLQAGQRIGHAAKNGDGNSMLHLEAWKKAPKGFTEWTPTYRPPDLLNITDYLNEVPK